MSNKWKWALLSLLLIAASAVVGISQNPAIPGSSVVQLQTAYYPITAISSTLAVNNQTTLTIPAPTQAGFYNYVCYLAFDASQNGTATANTNQVTTSTNFNAFALKYSLPATINLSYDWSAHWGTPGGGCVKSASPTTATTFVSPAALTNTAFTWYATYYQAP